MEVVDLFTLPVESLVSGAFFPRLSRVLPTVLRIQSGSMRVLERPQAPPVPLRLLAEPKVISAYSEPGPVEETAPPVARASSIKALIISATATALPAPAGSAAQGTVQRTAAPSITSAQASPATKTEAPLPGFLGVRVSRGTPKR